MASAACVFSAGAFRSISKPLPVRQPIGAEHDPGSISALVLPLKAEGTRAASSRHLGEGSWAG
jgi:hypothetical protein